MKKLAMRTLSIFLVIIMLASSMPIGSFAAMIDNVDETTENVDTNEASQENPFDYEIDSDNNALITGYSGDEYFLTVPDAIDEHLVTAIADNAFANNEK